MDLKDNELGCEDRARAEMQRAHHASIDDSAADEKDRARDRQFGYDALVPEEVATTQRNEPWLAGVIATNMMHYVYGKPGKDEGWSPYAAVAKRFDTREEAVNSALGALKKLDFPKARAVVQVESKAFEGAGNECEDVSPK